MKILTWLLAASLLAGPVFLLAQQRLPYDANLTEPDQELDDFRGGFAGLHRISAQLRGVRGLHSTVYWVSADGQQLTAYKNGHQIWQADVARAFAKLLPGASIDCLVFASQVVFVFTPQGGHAEVDRTTGEIAAVGVDVE